MGPGDLWYIKEKRKGSSLPFKKLGRARKWEVEKKKAPQVNEQRDEIMKISLVNKKS